VYSRFSLALEREVVIFVQRKFKLTGLILQYSLSEISLFSLILILAPRSLVPFPFLVFLHLLPTTIHEFPPHFLPSLYHSMVSLECNVHFLLLHPSIFEGVRFVMFSMHCRYMVFISSVQEVRVFTTVSTLHGMFCLINFDPQRESLLEH